jgi:DNA processing protein
MKYAVESVLSRKAGILALAEVICPTLNGPRARMLTEIIESRGDTQLLEEESLLVLDQALDLLDQERVLWWENTISQASYQVVDVTSSRYPTNLQLVHDRPPLLFLRGDLQRGDSWSIAIVGSRSASAERLSFTTEVASHLSTYGLTIVSGLAAGVDTAAHKAALGAHGRTISVFGTGISKVFPATNRSLAARIVDHGAAVSQFWPDMSGTKWSFPLRNAVTSGLALGTLVIEAGEKSGTRSQVQAALNHGRFVFLPQDLIERESWTHALLSHSNLIAFSDPSEIIHVLESLHELATTSLQF